MKPTTALANAYAQAEAEWRALLASPSAVFYLGMATCGRAAGAEATLAALRDFVAKKGIDIRIVEVGCLGPCSLEPLVIVQKPGASQICYGRVRPIEITSIVERHVLGSDPCARWALGTMDGSRLDGVGPLAEHPVMKGQVRNVLRNCGVIDPENILHSLARGGYRGFLNALAMGGDRILEQVKAAGLRGRGGAGFPTWKKWDTCRRTPGDTRYLICNADEGDPGAFMNRSLIEGDPHAVLEGMLIAGLTLGAAHGFVYCRAEYPLAIRRLEVAIKQMRELGLLGERIQGSDFSFEITIKKGAGAFVCGEETALIASIEGRRGMPRPRPPFPAVSGLWGMPTIIQNVETLGSLPLILHNGPETFAQLGTETSKGSKTFSLVGKVNRTGLIEVPLGTKLKDIVNGIGGGVLGGKRLKAVQTGGPSGGCIPAEKLDLPVDYESLAATGSIMGSGGLIVIDEDTCVVDLAKYFLSFTQEESCGKCPPCRIGTRGMSTILEQVSQGMAAREDLERLGELADTVRDGSLCGLGQTAPNPVLTTLQYFRDEYLAHIDRKECPAFVCQALVRYLISDERCPGCGACKSACPTEAIRGEKDVVHVIDQNKCIQCGSCLAVCPPTYAAVYRESGGLTRMEERKEITRSRKPDATTS